MFRKKVELTELFYDLVFVYAISQMTALIHHLEEGVLTLPAFLSFLVALIVSVNTWMVQTVFTNRYGKNSLLNMGFMLVSMMLVLGLSNSFSSQWTEGLTFYHFSLLVIGLTAVLLLQYFWEFFQAKDADNRSVIRFFIIMLTVRTVLLLLALLFPIVTAAIMSFAVVVATTLSPMVFTRIMALVPTNFPHLIERLSLLVIITFGEMLIGIAPYFKPSSFGWNSIWVFLTVASLFLFYIIEVDHLMDEDKKGVTGNGLIYFHYPIFAGLSMVTVSFSFFKVKDVQHDFLVFFLFAGLALFYLGVLLSTIYNKSTHRLSRRFLSSQAGLVFLTFLLSYVLKDNLYQVLQLTAIMTLIQTGLLLHFNIKHSR